MPSSSSPKHTVFITGGGAGIGAALARALHARGDVVIIAGRTRSKLDAVAIECPGMEVEELDVADARAVAATSARVADRHPTLDTVINNAGIQQLLDFSRGPAQDVDSIDREIDTNFKGLIYVSNAFLPLLKRQVTARLIHVGSGLGFVPLSRAPIYSATKAAVHSFTVSLRAQLRGGVVQVVEIIPPIVQTELHRGQSRAVPRAMPLANFTEHALRGLDAGHDEIPVGLARILRIGSRIAPGLFFGIVNKNRD